MKKSIVNVSAVISFALLSSGCIVHIKADASDFDRNSIRLTESFEHDASGLNIFYIDARAGDMSVEGVEGQTTITVEARIRTHESKPYELSIVTKGDSATLVAKHNSQNSLWQNNNGYIDLIVTMPADLALDIKDTSGDMIVSNVNNSIVIEDSSGDVQIRNTGGVSIDDSSGDVSIQNADGNVTIDDRSGDIRVTNASGDVVVEDSSGDITVRGAKSLNVIDDGSGSVYHSDIAGAVISK